jgi:hypothetical protein
MFEIKIISNRAGKPDYEIKIALNLAGEQDYKIKIILHFGAPYILPTPGIFAIFLNL